MIRVYDRLKTRLIHGAYTPGSRLDPAQLKLDLDSSTTPVRDALHRLVGEGIVDSGRNDGFRVRRFDETDIRNLYGWNRSLLHLMLREAARCNSVPPIDNAHLSGFASGMREMHAYLSRLSTNQELRRAVASLSDRALLLWLAEEEKMMDLPDRLAAMEAAIARQAWQDAGRLFDQLHRRRLAAVAHIAAAIRERLPSSKI